MAKETSQDPNAFEVQFSSEGESSENATCSSRCIPWWLRAEMASRDTSEDLRVAYRAILSPLYVELVLNAPDALRRSAGELLCSLTWIELRKQNDLAEVVAASLEAAEGREEVDAVLDGFLKIAREKMKMFGFIEKLRGSDTSGWMRTALVAPLRAAAVKGKDKAGDVGKAKNCSPKS